MDALMKQLAAGLANYPKKESIHYQYGTAGFRQRGDELPCAAFRVGVLAALRSKYFTETVGVMITASHNPAGDNGIKLVDPMGDMLETNWEAHATLLANAKDEQAVRKALESIVETSCLKLSAPAKVIMARDTRPSGLQMAEALRDAFGAMEVEYTDYGLATTPQLHFYTRCINTLGKDSEYGAPTEDGYYAKLSTAFSKFMKGKAVNGPVLVDCANGVGGPALLRLRERLHAEPEDQRVAIEIQPINTDTADPSKLNLDCGADYVKTRVRPPPNMAKYAGTRMCSYDGDADRLIYYYISPENSRFLLLDGDWIAILVATVLSELRTKAGLTEKLSMGVVQTAYANGSSTAYIREQLHLDVECASTGVKYLHSVAKRFDIGVYFEANGHGTVIFSAKALKHIRKAAPDNPAMLTAQEHFRSLLQLINTCVGDALSDMLLVEALLAYRKLNIREWYGMYGDLPNVLRAVVVRDRNVFVSEDADRKLAAPEGLQGEIDLLVGRANRGRAFVRKSGTEDVVRVYAEAASVGEAEGLSRDVIRAVERYGG